MSANNPVPPLAEAVLSHAAPGGPILRFEDAAQWLAGEARLREANHIHDQAKREAAALFASVQHEGFNAGYQQGLKEGLALITRTKASVDAYQKNLEKMLTGLVIDLMKQVVGEMGPGAAVAGAVSKALPKIDLRSEITLLVSPSVIGEVGQILSSQLDQESMAKIIIREDARLAPTQCRLESKFGVVDLSLDNQLELLAASLRSANNGIHT